MRVIDDGVQTIDDAGIYFTSYPSNESQATSSIDTQAFLLCDVASGRSLSMTAPAMISFKGVKGLEGYDSVFVEGDGDKANDQYIVYKSHQAIVKYIIHLHPFDPKILIPRRANNFSRTMIRPNRVFTNSDPMDLHFRTAESQYLRLHRRQPERLVTVEYIHNPDLIDKWENMKSKLLAESVGDELFAFHSTTSEEAIDNIVTKNFDVNKIGSAHDSGYWRKGFYFSEFPNVSLGYARGLRKFLLCKIIPGKSFECTQRMDGQSIQLGYHSHRVMPDSEGAAQELVIPKPDQILPLYILRLS